MAPQLAFDVSVSGDRTALVVSGEIDMGTASALVREVHSVLTDRPGCLVVDLSAVTFCDSSGVAALFRSREAATAVGCQFQIAGVTGIVHRVLKTVGALDALNAPP